MGGSRRRGKPLWVMAIVLSASCAGEITSPTGATPGGTEIRARQESFVERLSDLEVRVQDLRQGVSNLRGADGGGGRTEVLNELRVDAAHSLEGQRSPRTEEDAREAAAKKDREIQSLPLRFRLGSLSKAELEEKLVDDAVGPTTKIQVLRQLTSECDPSQGDCLDLRAGQEVAALLGRFNEDGEFHEDMLGAMSGAKDVSVRDAALTFLVGGMDARSRAASAKYLKRFAEEANVHRALTVAAATDPSEQVRSEAEDALR